MVLPPALKLWRIACPVGTDLIEGSAETHPLVCGIACRPVQWGRDCMPWDCDIVVPLDSELIEMDNPCTEYLTAMCTCAVEFHFWGWEFYYEVHLVAPYQPFFAPPRTARTLPPLEQNCLLKRIASYVEFPGISGWSAPWDLTYAPRLLSGDTSPDIAGTAEASVLPNGAVHAVLELPPLPYDSLNAPSMLVKWRDYKLLLGPIVDGIPRQAGKRYRLEFIYAPI